MSQNVREITENLLSPIVDEMGIELVDIEFKKEGKNWFLRIFIDRDGGIDLDDCTAVSERLSEILDEHDPIEQMYYLEVSSPGAERPLKTKEDVLKSVGKTVNVSTYAPIDGEKVFEGKLLSFQDDVLSIEEKVKTKTIITDIPYEKVAKIQLAISF